jgi:hypothetical protein
VLAFAGSFGALYRTARAQGRRGAHGSPPLEGGRLLQTECRENYPLLIRPLRAAKHMDMLMTPTMAIAKRA